MLCMTIVAALLKLGNALGVISKIESISKAPATCAACGLSQISNRVVVRLRSGPGYPR